MDAPPRSLQLHFNHETFPLSWPDDLSPKDATQAVSAACHAIVDGLFELTDSNGRPANLSDLLAAPDQAEFFLYKAQDIRSRGPEWRRLTLPMEPLKHLESQHALSLMSAGSTLLKHTRHGYPHLRQFELSLDKDRLLWYSASKPLARTQLEFSKVTRILLGQSSPVFFRYPLPALSHLSFSIFYIPSQLPSEHDPLDALKEKAVRISSQLQGDLDGQEQSLDLTCKNEAEMDIWVAGVTALVAQAQGRKLSKQDLLGHSRTYEALTKHQQIGPALEHFAIDPKALPNVMEQCICRRAQGKHEFQEALISAGNRLRDLALQAEELADSPDQATQDVSDAYSALTTSERAADDLLTQKNRLRLLAASCEELHEELTGDFQKFLNSASGRGLSAFSGETMVSGEPLSSSEESKEGEARSLDLRLWKLEIEVDNLNDIVQRVRAQHKPSLRERLKNLLPSFF